MSTSFSNGLAAAIEDRQLLNHPFYRRWEAGQLSFDELRNYAQQYRYFEAMLPRFLEDLAPTLPEGVARDSVLDNLADEVAMPSHLELFEKFANYFGASPAPISPAMVRLTEAYAVVLDQSSVAALAGLWAYESQGAKIADTKAEGLALHYGADGPALEFWEAHGGIEEHHAQWTLDALESLSPNADEAFGAARRVALAWWEFLDEREALSV